MDIKSKNNRNLKIIITVAVLTIVTAVNICFFPDINRNGQRILNEQQGQQTDTEATNKELLEELYRGSYVLYLEQAQNMTEDIVTASDLYLNTADRKDLSEQEKIILEDSLNPQIDNTIESWKSSFEQWRSTIDYCTMSSDGNYRTYNTSQMLSAIADNTADSRTIEKLKSYYSDYFALRFDSSGNFTIEPLYISQVNPDTLLKEFQQIDREQLLAGEIDREQLLASEINMEESKLYGPKDFTVVFGVPKTSVGKIVLSFNGSYQYSDYWEKIYAYRNTGAGALFIGSLIVVTILTLIMNSKRIWKTEISFERKGNRYLLEAAVIGVIAVLCMQNAFVELIWQTKDYMSMDGFWAVINSENVYNGMMGIVSVILYVFAIYAVWYLSIHYIRPVFTLGIKEYIRQYSFIYQIFPWIRKKWGNFQDEVGHIDFSEKSTKIIVKIVALNFVVLAVCTFLWFFGIGALVVYSLVLFFLIKKSYDKAGKDYQRLLRGVNKIAEGDLDSEIVEDLGVFEPFKAELAKIRSGFKLAVEEEVKSQRMKTELITNVSHDLKTPLTAITTYVELLKKENITEEEKRSYIETLEKKSLRLKVLIEDLFEVSKATSNSIKLDPMELDVINLMKQVSIEHSDKFEAVGLDLRWIVPEEKIVLMLDNQKTYRIFENLFVNVQKYAMPGSRVYVEAAQNEGLLEIVIKNMSAEPLNVKAEELTDRFVRGDSSRNTEGSGLGLAIAKSFTEAQGGNFNVEIDGDLFKVVIRLKCGILDT